MHCFLGVWDQVIVIIIACQSWGILLMTPAGQMTGFSILEEQMDEKYEPTQQEIKDYAEWLGIAEGDTDLLWIARQGLKTPLPKPWRPCEASSGEIFFYNPLTGASQWDHPCDEELRQVYLKEKAKQKEREEREKHCKDGKEDTASVSSIGEETEEKTPPEAEKPKQMEAERSEGTEGTEGTQKRLNFASESPSSASPTTSPASEESDRASGSEHLKKTPSGDLRKLIPERPNKPPPAKLRPPRPKSTSDLEEAFCKSPSPARAKAELERCQSPPTRSQRSPVCDSKFSSPSPPSPPTPTPIPQPPSTNPQPIPHSQEARLHFQKRVLLKICTAEVLSGDTDRLEGHCC